ncbi:hypothetical protein OG589_43005 [Sphaerisporangium sp. NBC_01403]|uniref:hypothetical protein n=1 Tax=Sphaerisporangium sp. NBC_01403 TaxID=2903599 RepID=UPI00324C9122
MHREIDRIGLLLSYDGRELVEDEQEDQIQDDLVDYLHRWDEELQPVLLEVQLMATPAVADLADRVSGALLDITTAIELRRTFIEYYPGWFQAQDLLEVLRNAMRKELGLTETLLSDSRHGDWPWLSDRPPRESYLQHYPDGRHFSETEEQFLQRIQSAKNEALTRHGNNQTLSPSTATAPEVTKMKNISPGTKKPRPMQRGKEKN